MYFRCWILWKLWIIFITRWGLYFSALGRGLLHIFEFMILSLKWPGMPLYPTTAPINVITIAQLVSVSPPFISVATRLSTNFIYFLLIWMQEYVNAVLSLPMFPLLGISISLSTAFQSYFNF
jgi:hypothetical protein